MYIAKSLLLGAWLVSFGTLAYLYFWFRKYTALIADVGALPSSSSIDYRVLLLLTKNLYWWAAMILCFAVAFFIVRAWPGRLGFWITVGVTELIPVGMLGLFLILVARLKALGKH